MLHSAISSKDNNNNKTVCSRDEPLTANNTGGSNSSSPPHRPSSETIPMLRNNLRRIRCDGRDSSCLPDGILPQQSTLYPQLYVDRTFWMEALAVSQSIISGGSAETTAAGAPHPHAQPPLQLTAETMTAANKVEELHAHLFEKYSKHLRLDKVSTAAAAAASPGSSDVDHTSLTKETVGNGEGQRLVMDVRGLTDMMTSMGAPCDEAVAAALIKSIQYATMDVRTLIRQRAASSSVGEGRERSCVDLHLSSVQLGALMRAVSTVIARRLVATKLYERSLARSGGARVSAAADLRSFTSEHGVGVVVSGGDDGDGAAARSPHPQPSNHDALGEIFEGTVRNVMDQSLKSSSFHHGVVIATEPVLDATSAGQVSSKGTALRRRGNEDGSIRSTSNSPTPTRRRITPPLRSSSEARSVASQSSFVPSTRGGESQRNVMNTAAVVGTSGIFRGALVPTRASLLRSNPSLHSPTVDVNGRKRSYTPPSMTELKKSSSAFQSFSSVRLRSETAAALTGDESGSTVRRAAATNTNSAPSPLSARTLLAASSSPRRSVTGTESQRTPSVARSVASASSARSSPRDRLSSPAVQRAAAAATSSPTVGFNPDHHRRIAQQKYGHISPRVQDRNISSVIHDGSMNPFVASRSATASTNSNNNNVTRYNSGAAQTTSPVRRRDASLLPSPTLHHQGVLSKAGGGGGPSVVQRSAASAARSGSSSLLYLSPARPPSSGPVQAGGASSPIPNEMSISESSGVSSTTAPSSVTRNEDLSVQRSLHVTTDEGTVSSPAAIHSNSAEASPAVASHVACRQPPEKEEESVASLLGEKEEALLPPLRTSPAQKDAVVVAVDTGDAPPPSHTKRFALGEEW